MPLSTTEGARALAEAAGVRLLSDQTVLRVSGDDARAWLNGQVTNDVGTPSPGNATYALVVSLKGRVLTDLWVLDHGEVLDLVLPSELAGDVAAHLDRFIIMEDVELEARRDVAVVTVQGPAASRVADRLADGPWWPCHRLGTGRERLVPEERAEDVLGEVAAAAAAEGGGDVTEEAWELHRLRVGVPRVRVDFGDFTYPQEAGLKERAVSFGKGCYQGQEAVVMLEHRGKPPKKLVRLELEATTPPDPGTALEDQDGRRLGEITSAAVDPDTPGRCPALGYLKRDAAAEGAHLRCGGATAVVRAIVGG
ncbi:MAG: YgfZ/GcvT domain-containing protein [Myxococcota bacterium]